MTGSSTWKWANISTLATINAETWSVLGTCPRLALSPMRLVRFNPDQFTAAGQPHNMFWPQHTELLLGDIKVEVWGVNYVCYDNALKLTVPLILIIVLVLPSLVGPTRS